MAVYIIPRKIFAGLAEKILMAIFLATLVASAKAQPRDALAQRVNAMNANGSLTGDGAAEFQINEVDSGVAGATAAKTFRYVRLPRIPCPSQDFDEFIQAFAIDEQIQMAFTLYPLSYTYVRNKSLVRRFLLPDQIVFPIMMMEDGGGRGGRIEIPKKQPNSINQFKRVIEYRDGLAYPTTYYFGRSKRCWVLEKVDEYPLRTLPKGGGR